MLRYKGILLFSVCTYIIASAIYCYSDDYHEDLVDILEVNSTIYAIVGSGRKFSVDLKPTESVQWSDAKGSLGAFLTNINFFVISNNLNDWQILPLKLSESENNVASLSPTLALLATQDRAIVFDAMSHRFIERQFPLRDELVAAETGEHIAIVVTSSRAFGVASGSTSFTQIHLKLNETIEAIKITQNKATVRTPDRLLTFIGQNSTWFAHRLN